MRPGRFAPAVLSARWRVGIFQGKPVLFCAEPDCGGPVMPTEADQRVHRAFHRPKGLERPNKRPPLIPASQRRRAS